MDRSTVGSLLPTSNLEGSCEFFVTAVKLSVFHVTYDVSNTTFTQIDRQLDNTQRLNSRQFAVYRNRSMPTLQKMSKQRLISVILYCNATPQLFLRTNWPKTEAPVHSLSNSLGNRKEYFRVAPAVVNAFTGDPT